MKLIVGLGNPGNEYTKTRHNAGFMVVDALASKHAPGAVAKGRFQSVTLDATIDGEKCLLLKPTTYMNLSGQAVGEAVRFFKIDPLVDMLVIVDDLYLATGAIRLRSGGGAAGHNGLSDIQRALGSDAYPRLRVGVGMQPNGGKPSQMNQSDFVLSRFTSEETPLLEASIAKAALAAACFATKGIAGAMNQFNAPETPKAPKAEPKPEPKQERKPDTHKPQEGVA
jgi:PTH1 family peptidyl-tRNA hydrolase